MKRLNRNWRKLLFAWGYHLVFGRA